MAKSKLGSAGRFGVRYGQLVKKRIAAIEAKQKIRQSCIFCNGRAKRLSKGIWLCRRCGKKFAGHAYYLEKTELTTAQKNEGKPENKEKAKLLKKENQTNNEEKPKKSVKKAKTSKSKSENKNE